MIISWSSLFFSSLKINSALQILQIAHTVHQPVYSTLWLCVLFFCFPPSPSPILVSKFRIHTGIYLQSRCCQLAFGQVEPTHRWNYPCFELKLFLDTRKLLLPRRRLLHLLLLHHVSLLQGDPCYGCTAGCGQGVKISGYVIASLSLSFYLEYNEKRWRWSWSCSSTRQQRKMEVLKTHQWATLFHAGCSIKGNS